MTMNNQVEKYLQYIQNERTLSHNTVLAYRQDLDEFLAFVKTETWPQKASTIDAFLAKQHDLGKKSTSISRMISSLRKFYQWLQRNELIKYNPMILIDLPKRGRQLPTTLSLNEVTRLLDQPNKADKFGLRDKAMLELLYATGMRVTELVNLKVSDIHPDLKLIQVVGIGDKERLIPVTDYALKQVMHYEETTRNQISTDSDYVFLNYRGQQLTRQAVWQIIKKYCKAAGIKKNVTPHTLRHTFATQLLDNGADLRVVQKILGHTNINTTQIYTSLTQKHILEVYNKAHPRA